MLRYILYIVFVISLAITSIKVFNLESKINYFISNINIKGTNEIINKTNISSKNKEFSYSEHIERGDSYLKQGFVEIAQDEFLKAIKKNPNEQEAYVKLGKAKALLKNYVESNINFEKANNISYTPQAQVFIAENHIHLFDFNKALQLLKPLETQNNKVDYLLDVLQIISVENIDPKMKIRNEDTYKPAQILKKAFDEFLLYQGSQNIFLKALIAKALIDNQNFEFAQYLTNNIIQERSDYRDAWIMLGYTYLNLENYQKAKSAYEKAYDLDPIKPETQFFLAISLEELGQKEQALEMYQLAYKNKYEPKVHVIQKIAELSMEFGYYDEAFKLYEELLSLGAEKVDTFIRPVFIAIDKLNDFSKAEKIAEWARNMYPEEAQSYNLLAWVEIEKGNLDKAQSYLLQAFQFNPNLAAVHYNQGLVYEKRNELQNALKSYEIAYQNDKDGPIGNLAAIEYNRIIQKID